MIALLALFLGIGLWLIGLKTGRQDEVNRRSLEYWWAFGAFFSGGLGALIPLLFKGLSADVGTVIRTTPLALIGLALVARTILGRDSYLPPAAFALFFCFGMILTGEGVAMPLASLLTLLPALIVPAKSYDFQALRAGAAAGISFFLILLAATVALQPNLFVGCAVAYKCSYFGVKLGLGAWGNSLGMFLGASIATTLLTTKRLYRVLCSLAGALICAELTGSRSGLAGIALAVGIAAAHFISQRLRSRVPVILAAASLCVSAVAVPFLSWSPSDLTFRPVLWREAVRLFGESPLFGYGASFWVRDRVGFRTGSDFAITTNYSTHNIWLEMLISGGVLGTVGFIFALALAAIGARRDFTVLIYTIALIGVLMGFSLTEVSSAPGRIYPFPGFLIYLFLIASATTQAGVRRLLDEIQSAPPTPRTNLAITQVN